MFRFNLFLWDKFLYSIFNRVVLKIVHCVFTEVCSVELCM